MKPEKQQLIHDLLGDDGRREATLFAGAGILQRRRRWRGATRGLFILAFLVVVGLWFARTNPRQTIPRAPREAAAPPASTRPQALTDDELLALFPDTPVGLATLSDGKQRLIFPRMGDEQKFITRL